MRKNTTDPGMVTRTGAAESVPQAATSVKTRSDSPELRAGGDLKIPPGPGMPRGRLLRFHVPDNDDYRRILDPGSSGANRSERQMYEGAIHQPWERAMSQWLPLNRALSGGRLPKEVLRYAGWFSAMSPNTSVPMQERHYGHLMDMVDEGHINPLHPIDEDAIEEFSRRAKGGELPRWNRDYYETHAPEPGSDFEEGESGELPQVTGLRGLEAFHPQLEDLVATHRDDGRTIAGRLMEAKAEWARHQNRKRLGGKTTAPEHPSLPGFGPKLTRYALAMLGTGNILVPDRHLMRGLYDVSSDDPAAESLRGVAGKPHGHPVLDKLDQHFFERHPAVQHVLSKYPEHFRGREQQAIFPAMWLHWLSSPHYDRLRGRENWAQNTGTDHFPFWASVADSLRRRNIAVPDLMKADSALGGNVLQILEELRQQHGEVGALMAWHSALVPHLLAEAASQRLDVGAWAKRAASAVRASRSESAPGGETDPSRDCPADLCPDSDQRALASGLPLDVLTTMRRGERRVLSSPISPVLVTAVSRAEARQASVFAQLARVWGVSDLVAPLAILDLGVDRLFVVVGTRGVELLAAPRSDLLPHADRLVPLELVLGASHGVGAYQEVMGHPLVVPSAASALEGVPKEGPFLWRLAVALDAEPTEGWAGFAQARPEEVSRVLVSCGLDDRAVVERFQTLVGLAQQSTARLILRRHILEAVQ